MEPNAYRHCTLCPRGCGVDRTSGARGFCGASDVVYVGRAALHAWGNRRCLVSEVRVRSFSPIVPWGAYSARTGRSADEKHRENR